MMKLLIILVFSFKMWKGRSQLSLLISGREASPGEVLHFFLLLNSLGTWEGGKWVRKGHAAGPQPGLISYRDRTSLTSRLVGWQNASR